MTKTVEIKDLTSVPNGTVLIWDAKVGEHRVVYPMVKTHNSPPGRPKELGAHMQFRLGSGAYLGRFNANVRHVMAQDFVDPEISFDNIIKLQSNG